MRRRNSTYSSRIPYENKSVRKLSIYDFAVVGIGFLSIRFRLFFVVSASEESRRSISGRVVVIASLSLLCRSLFLSASFVELYVSSQYSSEILSPGSAYGLCRSNLYYAAGLMKMRLGGNMLPYRYSPCLVRSGFRLYVPVYLSYPIRYCDRFCLYGFGAIREAFLSGLVCCPTVMLDVTLFCVYRLRG